MQQVEMNLPQGDEIQRKLTGVRTHHRKSSDPSLHNMLKSSYTAGSAFPVPMATSLLAQSVQGLPTQEFSRAGPQGSIRAPRAHLTHWCPPRRGDSMDAGRNCVPLCLGGSDLPSLVLSRYQHLSSFSVAPIINDHELRGSGHPSLAHSSVVQVGSAGVSAWSLTRPKLRCQGGWAPSGALGELVVDRTQAHETAGPRSSFPCCQPAQLSASRATPPSLWSPLSAKPATWDKSFPHFASL